MSVITVQNFAPVPMISIFTEPNTPMKFTNNIKTLSRSGINLYLPRKVRYKPRKQQHKEREIPGYRENCTYADFEHYLTEYPVSQIVEMDIVEGSGGKKEQVLLTFFFRKTATQIANHINSTARASLNGHTPFELAQLLLDKKLIQICHLNQISADQVTLKPSLIK